MLAGSTAKAAAGNAADQHTTRCDLVDLLLCCGEVSCSAEDDHVEAHTGEISAARRLEASDGRRRAVIARCCLPAEERPWTAGLEAVACFIPRSVAPLVASSVCARDFRLIAFDDHHTGLNTWQLMSCDLPPGPLSGEMSLDGQALITHTQFCSARMTT